jgi:hypothetical protein
LARADLINDFNIGAAEGIDSFSFSFTVPAFVGEGKALALAHSTSPTANNVWTMINDLTGHTQRSSVRLFHV